MSDLVNIIVDGIALAVQKGSTVVDAAKRVDIDIPVFCHHPKMEPVGMCRMCLVEVGMPMRDRATGEAVLEEDGSPKINWGRGLQTGCTVRVADGMVVRTDTEVVDEARETVIEFLLTSHPLDCPICDKGGECPLQNLTMAHGLGESEFDYSNKMHNEKHVPLGELIFLDRERCIQCARCTRFQDEVVNDPVIGFHNRGRALEIVTLSDPGFDSYWSGNTTDICPVGALTTADFRFGARPWELKPVASISPHGPVGENITMSTRQEAKSGGRVVIKRIMPRQNEWVNEIWISDLTRFVHHFADAPDRLTVPLIRQGGQLVETDWETALNAAAEKLKAAGSNAAAVTGERPSNEDFFALQKLFRQGLNSDHIDLANGRLAGGDIIAQVGLGSDSNLSELGRGDAIVVAASDLHEEAPLWWLRVKQAAERGATLITVNARPTRLDHYATHIVPYDPGQAVSTLRQLLGAAQVPDGAKADMRQVAEVVVNATNVVAFYGYEGLTYRETDGVARILANLLQFKNGEGHSHVGRKNNGLIAVWPHNNSQGAWDMGIHPAFGPGYQPLATAGRGAQDIYRGVQDGSVEALFVMAADPIGDGLLQDRGSVGTLIVQELFLTDTAKAADIVLPAQSWAERDGTFTSGERRVQRYYPAISRVGQCRPDWQIIEQIGQKITGDKPSSAASLIFKKGIAAQVPQYSELDYRAIGWVTKQFPDIGSTDLYYGGTSYENYHGLGLQWPSAAESGDVSMFNISDVSATATGALPIIRTAALYTTGTLINHTAILADRMARPTLHLHAADAARLKLSGGDRVRVEVNGRAHSLGVSVNGAAPRGLALMNGVPFVAGLIDTPIEKEIMEKEGMA